eukprot:9341729-Pyramimonas_sp.AAC.2
MVMRREYVGDGGVLDDGDGRADDRGHRSRPSRIPRSWSHSSSADAETLWGAVYCIGVSRGPQNGLVWVGGRRARNGWGDGSVLEDTVHA